MTAYPPDRHLLRDLQPLLRVEISDVGTARVTAVAVVTAAR